jgi:hypothetical protein
MNKKTLLLGISFCLIFSYLKAEEKIFLGDLKPMKAKVGFGGYYTINDGNTRSGGSDNTFNVNGKPAQRGLFTHADSEIVFAVPSGVKKFVAVGTMPNMKLPTKNMGGGIEVFHGSWSYEVFVDGVQVFESEPLCAYVKKEVPIEVEIPENAQHITLITRSLGSINADHSIWGEPYFIKP